MGLHSMKKILIDILFGVLTIIGVTIFEFLVSLPFGEAGDLASENYSSLINLELLLTALPTAIVTFVYTWLLKTKSKSDCVRRAAIWTFMIGLYYVLIGLGNNNLQEIFVTIGVYVLMICTFAGPVIYSRFRHLQ